MGSVTVNENSSVKNIKSLYKQIGDTLTSKEIEIVIDFSKTKEIDTSIAQVLLALKIKAKSLKKTIKLQGVSPVIKKQLWVIGLIK